MPAASADAEQRAGERAAGLRHAAAERWAAPTSTRDSGAASTSVDGIAGVDGIDRLADGVGDGGRRRLRQPWPPAALRRRLTQHDAEADDEHDERRERDRSTA